MKNLRRWLLGQLIAFCQRFGTPIRDPEGKYLCRAFVVAWRGRIHLIGLPNHVQLCPSPIPLERLSYWRQSIGWKQAVPPDYPRLVARQEKPTIKVCHVVICHLNPRETKWIYETWKKADPESFVLIAYGGPEECYQQLSLEIASIFIPDPHLRTIDHARERQRYSEVFRAAAQWLIERHPDTTHVHLAEFDVAPVTERIGHKLVDSLAQEDADVAGFGLVDLTNSIHPHNCHELAQPVFLNFLEEISCREARRRVLVMLGCSSIWTWEAFNKIAFLETPRVYLEMAMPTLAHHMGFRIRPLPEPQHRFITFSGDLTDRITEFRNQGAWLVHPCKTGWQDQNT